MKFLDVNQHLSELDEHIKVLKSYGDVFEAVEARITRVINMDGAFKGEGAKGVIYNHAHMQLPTIRSIRAFLISYAKTLEKMKANITEYEPASNGSVSEDFWKNQLPKGYDRYEETLEEREAAINQATAEVSHILHLGKLQTGNVYNSVDSARKHADTVLEGLYDLDQAGVELMAQVRTKMEELKATIRQVLDWTMTGGVRMSGVSIMEVGGYFANNATLHEKAPEVDTSKMNANVYDPTLADNPALANNPTFRFINTLINKGATPRESFILPFDYRNPIYYDGWVSPRAHVNQLTFAEKPKDMFGGEIIWEKDNGKLQITKGTEIDYKALGIVPDRAKINDDIIVHFDIIDDRLVIFKDDPNFYYYTQNAEMGGFHYYAAGTAQGLTRGYGAWLLGRSVAAIPTVGPIAQNIFNNASDPSTLVAVGTAAGTFAFADKVPAFGHILGTPVPKSGTKEVLVYLSEDKDDWKEAHKVLIKVDPTGDVSYKAGNDEKLLRRLTTWWE
ncbi:ribonuclease YeeF family protein [Halalkalibacterium halodurans]|uniref:LXG domain-containing protein n=1 Tax=Halalkalibacterium halodurans TaxID=86665 RepID=A0A0M0KM28_ALKHA|nr:T7SS effector LXG polymorphic toxin [Halalkalibacterium halodurans]